MQWEPDSRVSAAVASTGNNHAEWSGNSVAAENRKKAAPRGKPFEPGNSANPGGRPKKTEEQRKLEEMCRAKTTEAFDTIMEIMMGGQEKSRLSAAQYIIDRGWGKAPSITEMTVKGDEDRPLGLRVVFGRAPSQG